MKRVYISPYITKLGSSFNGCPNIEEVFISSRNWRSIDGHECFRDIDKDKCVFIVPDGWKKDFERGFHPKGVRIIEQSQYTGVSPVMTDVYGEIQDWTLDGRKLPSTPDSHPKLTKDGPNGQRIVIR